MAELIDDRGLISVNAVEELSILENAPGYNDAVVTVELKLWFDDKVVLVSADLGVELLSSTGMIGRPGDAEEVLTVSLVANDGVEDAVCASVAAAATVVLKCCVLPVAKASGTGVVITPATGELLNELKLAIVEEVSTLDSASENTDAVITGKANVWFDDEVAITDVKLGVVSVSLGRTIGRPDAAEEALAVVGKNGVEDAIFVPISPSAAVVLKCCVVPVVEALASAKTLNRLKLLGDNVLDNIDVALLSTVDSSTDSMRDTRTVDDVDKDGD